MKSDVARGWELFWRGFSKGMAMAGGYMLGGIAIAVTIPTVVLYVVGSVFELVGRGLMIPMKACIVALRLISKRLNDVSNRELNDVSNRELDRSDEKPS